ncbi:MAG: hypothetical protein RDV00_00310 [Clostridia bacterium]|nr:hypothetical protein [Clostridia bacterium]MDQ7790559.1 hypothetical protein [Clostridia bacterium]
MATVFFSVIAEMITRRLASVYLAVIFLLLIIIISVIFDIIGTAAAATAADEAPFHAKASKRVFGAQQSVYLVRNADRVANFTQDVVGDIAGIVAGALGISLMVQVVLLRPGLDILFLNVLITALIASMVVGGKAYGKTLAVRNPNEVIFMAGRLLALIERVSFCNITGNSRGRTVKKKKKVKRS